MAKAKRMKSAARSVQKESTARKSSPSKIPAAKKTSPVKLSPKKKSRRYSIVHGKARRSLLQTPVKTRSEKQQKKRRFRPGTRALMEIRHYQKTSLLLIPRRPFSRLVRETMLSLTTFSFKIQPQALLALQEAAEAYLVMYMEDAVLAQIHAQRKTLMKKDLILATRIRGRSNPAYF